MLVHICCSVDSHYFLSELQKVYPDEKLVGFFYNPNIHPKAEHDLRLSDVRRSCSMLGIPLEIGVYDIQTWLGSVRGQEHEPEKGARCSTCFDVRLERTAQLARAMGEQRFTTTLLSSPMKEQEILYQQGDTIAQGYGLDFIKINVRKNGGVQKQNELAKRDNLYRQNYCGCQFALAQQREKQDRLSLEMMSEIGGRVLPGSIPARQETFAQRDALESTQSTYMLTQRKTRIWRLLYGKVSSGDSVIHSHIIAHSESKKLKPSSIAWHNIRLESLLESSGFSHGGLDVFGSALHFTDSARGLQMSDRQIRLGLCSRDDSVFLCLNDFNALMQTGFANVLELMYRPVPYGAELLLRDLLCGRESCNPIIIIDREEPQVSLEIGSIFQEEKPFYTIPVC